MTTTTLSVLFSLSTAVVVGSFTLFVRSGQRHANAVSGVLIGIIVSFPTSARGCDLDLGARSLPALAWLFFALAGVMGPAVGRVCFFHSIHLIGVARAVPLNSTMPLFSAIIGNLCHWREDDLVCFHRRDRHRPYMRRLSRACDGAARAREPLRRRAQPIPDARFHGGLHHGELVDHRAADNRGLTICGFHCSQLFYCPRR